MLISKRLILGLACTALCAAFAGCGGDGGSSGGGGNHPVTPSVTGDYLFQINSLPSGTSATMLVSNTSTNSEDIKLSSSHSTVAPKYKEYTEDEAVEAEEIGPHDLTNILAEKFRPTAQRVALNAKVDGKYSFTPNTEYTDCAKGGTVEINVYKSLKTLSKINVKKMVDNSETSSILVFSEMKNDGSTVISHEKALEMDKTFGKDNIYHKNGTPIDKTVRDAFGREFSPGLDGTEKIIIFVLQSSTIGNGVFGYFNGADEYTVADSKASNEGEILYINGEIDDYDIYSTIGHEFQHMCCYNQKVILDGEYTGTQEITSVNEGRSVLAEDLCGFGLKSSDGTEETCNGFILQCSSNYMEAPEKVSFNEFNNKNAEYGGNYLMQRYVADRYGIGAVTAAATNTTVGLDNVAHCAGTDFKSFFMDFGLANLLSNYKGTDKSLSYTSISLTEKYGPDSKQIGRAEPADVIINDPSNIAKTTMYPYSNNYYRFTCSGNVNNMQVGLTVPSASSMFKMALISQSGFEKFIDAVRN